jgi:nitroreductase
MGEIRRFNGYPFTSYQHEEYPEAEMLERATRFHAWMETRRSVRAFSDRPVSKDLLHELVMTASSAPSGAHKQPWSFCLVFHSALKKKIREAAEKEERQSYEGRMSAEWLEDLAPLQTDWQKEFLETAPCLVVVFKRSYEFEGKKKRQNYYVTESCGLACGFLLVAIHNAGLVALTHTPSPMNFLAKILNRPANEKPFLLIPVGYPAEECFVPDLKRKTFSEVVTFY